MEEKDSILNPTVFIGEFEWREPITSLTDFLIALVCGFAIIQLSRNKSERSDNYMYYKLYFIFFGLAMFSAAWLGHGLVAYVGNSFKVIGWTLSTIAYLFLAKASLIELNSLIKPFILNTCKALIYLNALIFLALLLNPYTSNFQIAQISSAASLIGIIIPLNVYNYYKTRSRGSSILILSIFIGIITAFVYNNQLSFSKWFNEQDLSHLLVAISTFVMYRGASKLAFKSTRLTN